MIFCLSDIKRNRLTRDEARRLLEECGIPLGTDFFDLTAGQKLPR